MLNPMETDINIFLSRFSSHCNLWLLTTVKKLFRVLSLMNREESSETQLRLLIISDWQRARGVLNRGVRISGVHEPSLARLGSGSPGSWAGLDGLSNFFWRAEPSRIEIFYWRVEPSWIEQLILASRAEPDRKFVHGLYNFSNNCNIGTKHSIEISVNNLPVT